MRDGSIGSWVRVVISPVDEVGRSVRGFVAISPSRGGDEDGDRFVGSWRDLADGRGGSISSWVHGAISPSRGGDEDGDLTNAISNSTARSLSVYASVSPFSLSLSLSLFACLRK